MTKRLCMSSYIRNPSLIYAFAPDLFQNSLYMTKSLLFLTWPSGNSWDCFFIFVKPCCSGSCCTCMTYVNVGRVGGARSPAYGACWCTASCATPSAPPCSSSSLGWPSWRGPPTTTRTTYSTWSRSQTSFTEVSSTFLQLFFCLAKTLL